ncbi:hypothetical protein PV797_19310 [Clostridiaceae bacterium M8S5]|nr:hypothetical protein PV797_19310 [Clostridiaceae bacterium M8S5]
MKNKDYIEKKIRIIIKEICKRDIEQLSSNIFIYPISMSSRELAYIFVEIEKEFNVDLNLLVEEYKNHTIAGLINAVISVQSSLTECV